MQDAYTVHETGSLLLLSSTLSSRTRVRLLYFTFYELPSVFIEALDSQHMLATLKSLSFQSVRTYTYGEFYPAFDLPAHYQFIARLVNRSLEDFFHILSVKSNANNIFLRFKRVDNT